MRDHDAVERVITMAWRAHTATVLAESTNPYDSNAVVVTTPAGEKIGYVPRGDAALYQRLVNELKTRGIPTVCPARLVGGTADKPSIGVYLDLDRPTNIAKRFGFTLPHGASQPSNDDA